MGTNPNPNPNVVKWNEKEIGKTITIKKTLNPVWKDESFKLRMAAVEYEDEEDKAIAEMSEGLHMSETASILEIEVWDYDIIGTHDFLGCIVLTGEQLAELLDPDCGTKEYTLGQSEFLEKREQSLVIESIEKGNAGSIVLSANVIGAALQTKEEQEAAEKAEKKKAEEEAKDAESGDGGKAEEGGGSEGEAKALEDETTPPDTKDVPPGTEPCDDSDKKGTEIDGIEISAGSPPDDSKEDATEEVSDNSTIKNNAVEEKQDGGDEEDDIELSEEELYKLRVRGQIELCICVSNDIDSFEGVIEGKTEYKTRDMNEQEKEIYLPALPGSDTPDGGKDKLSTIPLKYYTSRRSYVLGDSKFLSESDNELSIGGLLNMSCSIYDRAPLLKYRPSAGPHMRGIVGADEHDNRGKSYDTDSEDDTSPRQGESEEPASSLDGSNITGQDSVTKMKKMKKKKKKDPLQPVNTCPHPHMDVFEEDWDRPDLFDHEEDDDGDLDWDADLDEDVRLLRDAKRLQRDRAKQGVKRLICRNKHCEICHNEYGRWASFASSFSFGR